MPVPSYASHQPLNLGHSVVDEFWASRDQHTRLILSWMVEAEHWRLDDKPGVSQSLLALAPKLDQASPEALQNMLDLLIQFMAYLSSPRAMRLIEWMDERFEDQGMLMELLSRAAATSDSRPSALMLDRIQTIKSLMLLGRIFSRERVQEITHLLEQQENYGL
jgi:hypothetical protein